MKRNFYLGTLLWVFFAFTIPAKAQTQATNYQEPVIVLGDKEKTEITNRIKTMLDNFLYNLSIIGSKDKAYTVEVKDKIITATLRLFVNRGEPYQDIYSNWVKAPHMQISSLRNGVETKVNRPIKEYLNNLKNINYKKVTITRSETIYLSNLYWVDNHYEAVATYLQYFTGEKEDGLKYSDVTKKSIRIIVEVYQDEEKMDVIVRFSDIDVIETKR